MMMPRIIIRIENLLLVVFGCWIYYHLNEAGIYLSLDRWYLLILVWLSVDLSMVGYLINKKIGSYIYNLVHNYILVFMLIITGFGWYKMDLVALGAILMIHIGIDRFLGFGLKYPSNFKDTHMQKI